MSPFSRNSNAGGATVVTTTTTTTTPTDPAYPNTRAGRGAKPSLMDRLKGNNTSHSHHTAAPVATTTKKSRFGGGGLTSNNRRVNKNTTTAVPNGTTKNGVPRRKVGLGDKMSGAMMKAKGSMTHRPGQKAAGTRRMHGTDGKGSTRAYY